MKRGFSLIELLAAVLLGALIVAVVAGTLSSAINAWESVQTKVSENYNRRTVLDLVKRQASSIFYRRDANQMGSGSFDGGRNRGDTGRRDNQARGNNNAGRGNSQPTFKLPADTYFFRGTVQELSFLSTVSFLSDFPGQVSVRYYVIQGDPEQDAASAGVNSSRLPKDVESLEGISPMRDDLYLVLEEQNLFLSIMKENEGEEIDSSTTENPFANRSSRPEEMEQMATLQPVNTMVLLGPLRTFELRYRIPARRKANEADTDEDWAEFWDVEKEGGYPTAVEFTLRYEKPGVTDDWPDEDLPGIRMVLPIYDSRNLVRGENRSGDDDEF